MVNCFWRAIWQSEWPSWSVWCGEQYWKCEHVTYKVVYDISESPHHWHTEEGNAQEHNVKYSDTQCIGQPDPSTVHDPCIWVHLTVCHTHIHSGLWTENIYTYIHKLLYTYLPHFFFHFPISYCKKFPLNVYKKKGFLHWLSCSSIGSKNKQLFMYFLHWLCYCAKSHLCPFASTSKV